MKPSKWLTFLKPRMLLLVFILVLAGSVVFITRPLQKASDHSYLQTLEGMAFNKYLPSPIPYDNVYH